MVITCNIRRYRSTGEKMVKQDSKNDTEMNLLNLLLEDPTIGINEMAKKLNINRQTVWRIKKKLEKNRKIWGYTAIIDRCKLNERAYLIFGKTKPINKRFLDTLLNRILGNKPYLENIRTLDMFYVSGNYDWILRFSAPDHLTAKKYVNALRETYADQLFEKPVLVDIDFCLIAEGKKNPELKKLYDFIPNMED